MNITRIDLQSAVGLSFVIDSREDPFGFRIKKRYLNFKKKSASVFMQCFG
jgi:hypothetical protein